MLKVTDLTKAFGDRTAVNGVSFHIDEGETFGLLGPNESPLRAEIARYVRSHG